MKKKLFPLACVALLACVLCLLPGLALGDAGGYSGSSNYGGGSSSSSSGSSSYSDSGSSYYYGGSSSSDDGDDDPVSILIGAIVVAVIVVVVIRAYKKNGKTGALEPAGAERTPAEQLKPMADIQQTDPNFRDEALTEKISNLYVQMQNAWTAKDFEPMKPYFTDALYTQFDRQLDELRNSHQTNHVDKIAVLGVALRGWYETDENQCVVAEVRTRIVDYNVDDKTGEVVAGSKDEEKFMTYEYTMIRTKGTITAVQKDETESKLCPNCGAPININHTARCEYCGSVVNAKDFDWVIGTIKGLSQQSTM